MMSQNQQSIQKYFCLQMMPIYLRGRHTTIRMLSPPHNVKNTILRLGFLKRRYENCIDTKVLSNALEYEILVRENNLESTLNNFLQFQCHFGDLLKDYHSDYGEILNNLHTKSFDIIYVETNYIY